MQNRFIVFTTCDSVYGQISNQTYSFKYQYWSCYENVGLANGQVNSCFFSIFFSLAIFFTSVNPRVFMYSVSRVVTLRCQVSHTVIKTSLFCDMKTLGTYQLATPTYLRLIKMSAREHRIVIVIEQSVSMPALVMVKKMTLFFDRYRVKKLTRDMFKIISSYGVSLHTWFALRL